MAQGSPADPGRHDPPDPLKRLIFLDSPLTLYAKYSRIAYMEGYMPSLQVRDIPKELYETIARVAQTENRSIAQQTIVLLKNALRLTDERIARRKSVLREIDNLNIKGANSFPDPAELVREDRDR
jgi:hypothetical protein